MARIPTISVDLSKYSMGNAIVQYKLAGNGMRGNVFFLIPDVSTVLYDAAGTDFESLISTSHRTPPITAAIKKARLLLNSNYKIQGNYVIRTSKGDIVKLTSSNFVMGKDGETRENPILKVTNGLIAGDIDITCKADPTVHSYWIDSRLVSLTSPNEFEFCTIMGIHEGRKTGFISGELYEFRLKYIYSSSESDYFESVILRIL